MCWTQHCAWTCSLRWRDSCLLQHSLLEITCVPKHRSGPPPHRSASRVPFICSRLQNSLVRHRAPGEILSSDAMYYKQYIGTLMVLTSITLSWRKFSFFCPFISGSYFCFPALIIFSETLVCVYHFVSFKLTCSCSLIVLQAESTIFGIRWNLVPITFPTLFWLMYS